jgi:hypothetical protein
LNSIAHKLGAFLAVTLSAVMLWGQGAQLPKYKVSQLPNPTLVPTHTVQVIDGANSADCTVGYGNFNVICMVNGGAWVPAANSGPVGPPGPPGPPGGSLSYPGVVSNGNSGLSVQGTMTTPSVTGYRQNNLNARSRNRDEVLQITITPQDMPGCANSGMGLIDDAPCFNAAIHYLASFDDNVQRRLIAPYTQYGYQFLSAGYQQPLPHDFGDYHGFAGYATQASVQLQIINGVVASCSTGGGTAYAPSATLPVWIYDPSLQGSGGYATVATDTTGAPTSCTVVQGGIKYPPSGVIGQVVPIGGDGASANATLASNTFSTGQNPITVTGGSGYASLTTNVPVNTFIGPSALQCTAYPTFTATCAAGVCTAVNVGTTGTNCTYNGSASATVPLYFGATCGGAQCTLMAPETPINLPCAVGLINNITIEGIGNPTITTGWDLSTVNNSQMIAFCDPTGIQSTNITIKNLTINAAFIGFWFPYVVHHLAMTDVTFGGSTGTVGIPVHAYSFSGGPQSGSAGANSINLQNVGANPPYLPSTFTNIADYGYAGITCGGEWIGRSAAGYTASSSRNVMPGGYQTMLAAAFYNASSVADGMRLFAHYNDFSAVSPCGNVRVDNYLYKPLLTHSTTTDNIDKWFEQYVWKTQDGPASAVTFTNTTNFLSNGLASVSNAGLGCKFTQTVVDRTIDYQFGNNTAAGTSNPGGVANYPFYQCFPGVTFTPLWFMPRYSGNTLITNPMTRFMNIYTESYVNRPVVMGRFDDLNVEQVNIWARTTFTDPYQQTGEARAAINMTSRKTSSSLLRDITSVPTAPTFSPMYQNLVSGFASNVGQHMFNIQNTPFTSGATITGCGTLTSPLGGAGETPWHMAGSFVSNTSATCTAVITPGSTAPNGWRCAGTDIGTQAPLNQSVTSTVSCTITGTTTLGHAVTWIADAY